ncbi:acyl-ACP--UDP-N-acetylglucosamine O-acyltransferase [Devosia psychrophila]|uniref:Acyl-[acyl-carrier-protein]--UDP-N-acetylglucosamine O-acyltransferase n=1 Tax=Devosia psychrophila TaxID=728005 RepID=A0A0F5Q1M7_9HYPH|nr:acyl-ACP--UDP-N-acetylglucosamine O-acyltransferase [Devosia psychrophila]KKC34817.1 UDP-N-acetylglucosamine acyltransferase [Devosia psychrophila]SFC09331.1 acyl-[acyl-carrier-protein]--UDP-N-acetylglucosamine O-acyltransferase [Devosia psychrophila]
MSSAEVHSTAIVAPGARLGNGVKVGPFCIVGRNVVLHDRVELVSHVSIDGHTEIGADTQVYPFASIGHKPQDLKYHGEASRLVIGERCTIRESVTINPGTENGGMLTKIGNDCLIMACAHVAHDAIIGNNVIMANYVGIAGHCQIGDNVIFGGTCVIHQFTRIGAHAFIGAQSMVDGDVIPYGMAVGNRATLTGLNLIGLKRRKFDREAIHQLRAAYRQIFASEGTLRERVEDAAELFKNDALVQEVVAFIAAASDRPILLPRNGNAAE